MLSLSAGLDARFALPPDSHHSDGLICQIRAFRAFRPFRLPYSPDIGLQGSVALRTGRQPARNGALGDVSMVGRRRDRQYPADRFDTVNLAMRVDERDHGFDRRSNSAIAK
jgi:hypothetical protein